jgi:hypothetical protein
MQCRTILAGGFTTFALLTGGWSLAGASSRAYWLDFPAGPFPVGVTTAVGDSGGTLVDLTVQTGGSQGAQGVDLDTLGVAETGLNYTNFHVLGIFDGGGTSRVLTTLTFSNIRPGPSHHSGLLMVGAMNGGSSPVTVTSSVAGRVVTWTVVGQPFDLSADNSFPVDWDPGSGQIQTSAPGINDSQGIVVDLGDLHGDGTVTLSLGQALFDGIFFGFGEEVLDVTGVEDAARTPTLALARPTPNPTRSSAQLQFQLPASGHARISAYDVAGRLLAVIVDGDFTAGPHLARWDLGDRSGLTAAPGVVCLRLEASGEVRTQKLLILR